MTTRVFCYHIKRRSKRGWGDHTILRGRQRWNDLAPDPPVTSSSERSEWDNPTSDDSIHFRDERYAGSTFDNVVSNVEALGRGNFVYDIVNYRDNIS